EIIILDEAQRIKNFETKTHKALSALPREHVLVLTGTPLENKLEDIYSIVQFCDSDLLTPLWAFAANHLNLDQKNKVQGYRNLKSVHDKLRGLILRRRRKDVLDSLPEQVTHEYYLPLTAEQEQIHQGYMAALLAIINKKIITPMDMKRIQMLLLCARMVCDSTYLIDKETNISPKLVELGSILNEIVIENGRKAIIFSEWTTMTYLIGKLLSDMGIGFVEFTGKVPVTKRHQLVEEFHDNDECMVFLSSDAGGVGLNLQNADCVINFELPWNPAKLNQRIGRVSRIGQQSAKIDVITLLTKNSIEERVYAAVGLKQQLFDIVLDGEGDDEVDFSRESKSKFINQVRALFDEDPVDVRSEPVPGPELAEDTPHYLNPKVLAEGADIDLEAEEFSDEDTPEEDSVDTADGSGEHPVSAGEGSSAQPHPVDPEQLEAVLNQGLSFLDSLARITTGKALSGSDDAGGKSIEIDRKTGQVTLKFKLPGF
ncbi:MAG: DEAD/DEAH box helicase, partial [Spirochaetia bacterium]